MSYTYITDSGTILPDTSTTLARVQKEYRDALGQDLNLDPNTPQGQLITAETMARNDVLRNNAALANQLNPNQSTGVHLRSIGALMGLEDTPLARSVCLGCIVTGAPNTLFPAGSRATNRDGADFLSITDILLDVNGLGTVNFQCNEPGPIEVSVDGLSPAQPVQGWSRVVNPTPAIVGSTRMTNYQYRVFRQNALANQSQNAARSISSKLSMLPGVRSVLVRENDDSAQQTIDGVGMEANSVWVCVNDDGGLGTDIVSTLMECKPPGCKLTLSTNGRGTPVTTNHLDPITGQLYTLRYTRSVPRNVHLRIRVRNSANMSDLVTSVANAVLAYAAGETDNEAGLVVGASVSPFTISGAVVSQIPGTTVPLCEVSTDGVNWQTTQIEINAWERAVLPRGNIEINVEK